MPVPVIFDPKTGGSGSGTGFFHPRQVSVVSIRGGGRDCDKRVPKLGRAGYLSHGYLVTKY